MIDKLLRENSPIIRRPLFIKQSNYDTKLMTKLYRLKVKYSEQPDKFKELICRYEQKLKPKSFLDWLCCSLDDDRLTRQRTLNYFTNSTIFLNISGSSFARSASIFRSRAICFFFKAFINLL